MVLLAENNKIKQENSRNEEKKREETKEKKEYKKGYNNIQFFVISNSWLQLSHFYGEVRLSFSFHLSKVMLNCTEVSFELWFFNIEWIKL